MTEMIERVAKAVYNDWRGDGKFTSIQLWVDLDPDARAEWLACARAAIEAMREPTEAMWEAAWEASGDYFVSDAVTREGFNRGISAMIDVALAPENQHLSQTKD